jgi:hypothetical protein
MEAGAILAHDAKPRKLDAERGAELVVAIHVAIVARESVTRVDDGIHDP